MGIMVDPVLSYWLSWFIILSDPIDVLIFFSMAILLAQGERLALGPIRVAICELDECVNNILRSVGRYDVVPHADTYFLQIFL